MSCVDPTFWENLPAGSKFVISASGDPALFNISVGVNLNGNPDTVWKHDQIVPGPKKRAVAAGDDFAFHVLVDVFHEPAAGHPVHVEAYIEHSGGTSDPAMNCTSDFVHAGHFPLTFFVSA